MAPSLTLDVIQDPILQPLLDLASDPIPNIRFNVAKSLEVLAVTFGNSPEGQIIVKDKIVPSLQTLKNDSDADVRYFASRALAKTIATVPGAGEIYSYLYRCLVTNLLSD